MVDVVRCDDPVVFTATKKVQALFSRLFGLRVWGVWYVAMRAFKFNLWGREGGEDH